MGPLKSLKGFKRFHPPLLPFSALGLLFPVWETHKKFQGIFLAKTSPTCLRSARRPAPWTGSAGGGGHLSVVPYPGDGQCSLSFMPKTLAR